jgi:hypothetical protein
LPNIVKREGDKLNNVFNGKVLMTKKLNTPSVKKIAISYILKNIVSIIEKKI